MKFRLCKNILSQIDFRVSCEKATPSFATCEINIIRSSISLCFLWYSKRYFDAGVWTCGAIETAPSINLAVRGNSGSRTPSLWLSNFSKNFTLEGKRQYWRAYKIYNLIPFTNWWEILKCKWYTQMLRSEIHSTKLSLRSEIAIEIKDMVQQYRLQGAAALAKICNNSWWESLAYVLIHQNSGNLHEFLETSQRARKHSKKNRGTTEIKIILSSFLK